MFWWRPHCLRRFAMRQFWLCVSHHTETPLHLPLIMQIPFSFRVKNGGTTDRPEEIFQVVGLEGEPLIDEFIKGITPTFQGMTTALRQKAEGTGEGTRQANDPRPTRIAQLAFMYCNVLLSGKDTSWLCIFSNCTLKPCCVPNRILKIYYE